MNYGLHSIAMKHWIDPVTFESYIKSVHSQVNDNTRLIDPGPAYSYVIPKSFDELSPQFYKQYSILYRPKPGCKAKLWRVIGDLLNSKLWYERGNYSVIDSPPSTVVTIHLKSYGMRSGTIDILLRMGYEPTGDILIIGVRNV